MTCTAFYAVLIFLVINTVASQTRNCPKIYERFSTDHSYCKTPSSSCNIIERGITQQKKDEILRLHNSFRSVMAIQSTNGLPPAANMLQMEWDSELATIAQRYAEQCIYAHDKPNQRRVRNFGVGQNIAIQRITGQNVNPPQPDWSFAVGDWFEEIVYFSSDMVCPFPQPSADHPEYRHFSELVWATSFRLGCGYVMYKEGNTYLRLYVCNYGPAGNTYGSCVYKTGPGCSQCPDNTCCGDQCGGGGRTYPGLCKRYDNGKPPVAPLNVPTLFYCDFNNPNQQDCLINTYGDNSWYIYPALGGYYLEVVLNPGQNGTIVFSKQIKPKTKKVCVTLSYRKGPNLARNPTNNKALELFVIPSMNHYTFTQTLPGYDGEARQQFSTFNLTLQWDQPTTAKLSFAVPQGAQPQFFNVDSIIATDSPCQN